MVHGTGNGYCSNAARARSASWSKVEAIKLNYKHTVFVLFLYVNSQKCTYKNKLFYENFSAELPIQ